MMARWLLLLALLPGSMCLPGYGLGPGLGFDDPPPAPADRKEYSPNHHYFFETRVAQNRTDVYEAAKPGTPLWTLPFYLDSAFLANDGRHLAVEYRGGNILEASVKPSDTLFTFFSPGVPPKFVSVGSVVGDISKLPRTSSGYGWGNAVSFDKEGLFVLMLSDGRTLRLDPDNPRP